MSRLWLFFFIGGWMAVGACQGEDPRVSLRAGALEVDGPPSDGGEDTLRSGDDSGPSTVDSVWMDLPGDPVDTAVDTVIEDVPGTDIRDVSVDTVDPCSLGIDCDDGDPCNGVETCREGHCVAIAPPPICDDGKFCNGQEICERGVGCRPGPPAECDDGDPCNGQEKCDVERDACVRIPEDKDCDDGKDCTKDFCDPRTGECRHDVLMDRCPCRGVPVQQMWNRDFDLRTPNPPCPLVGGTVGQELKLELGASYTAPHCGNACKGNASVTGALKATLKMCKYSETATGRVTGSYDREKCLQCDTDRCEQTCVGEGCDTIGGSGRVSMRMEKFWGIDSGWKSGPVELGFKCGASLAATPSVGGGVNVTDGSLPCKDCQQCLAINGDFGVEFEGNLGCALKVSVLDGWVGGTIGCQNCATLTLNGYGGVGGQVGQCPGKLCGFAGAEAKLRVKTPCIGFSVGWFGVAVECEGSIYGCAEANTCGTCRCNGCADAGGSMSCSVNWSGSCP